GPSPAVEPSPCTPSFAPTRGPATTVSTTARPPLSTTRLSSSKTVMPAPAPAQPAPPLPGRLRRAYADSRSLQRLDEDVDLAAARQADLQCHLVGDAVGDETRGSAPQHVLRGEHDVALDAAAGDGACELPALADGELRADGPRRCSAGRDDRGERDLLAARAPAIDVGQQLLHGFNLA